MNREYRGHKYEVTKLGEGRYRLQVWLPNEGTRAPGYSFGSPRTEDEADRMAKDWIDLVADGGPPSMGRRAAIGIGVAGAVGSAIWLLIKLLQLSSTLSRPNDATR